MIKVKLKLNDFMNIAWSVTVFKTFCCSTSGGLFIQVATFISTAARKLGIDFHGYNHLFTGNIS